MRTVLLATTALLFGAFSLTFGAVRTTIEAGNWDDPATWAGGVVPSPTDEAVVATGHLVVFDSPTDTPDECARLTVEAGATLTLTSPAGEFHVGGNGAGVPGGVQVHGLLTILGATTLSGRSGRECDGGGGRPGRPCRWIPRTAWQLARGRRRRAGVRR